MLSINVFEVKLTLIPKWNDITQLSNKTTSKDIFSCRMTMNYDYHLRRDYANCTINFNNEVKWWSETKNMEIIWNVLTTIMKFNHPTQILIDDWVLLLLLFLNFIPMHSFNSNGWIHFSCQMFSCWQHQYNVSLESYQFSHWFIIISMLRMVLHY